MSEEMGKTIMPVILGMRVKNRINGFSGIVTGRCDYLTGCVQFLVTPERLKEDGSQIDGLWIDEMQLVRVDDEPPVIKVQETVVGPGGPQNNTPPVSDRAVRKV
jgi:hypothetical protein